jgi:hypothetical protein
MTFSAEPLPSGVVLAGNVLSGASAEIGVFSIVLTAVNAAGSDSQTLLLTVEALTSETDTDGDGFPDELETAVGSSPTDAASTPLPNGVSPASEGALTVSRMRVRLDFGRADRDEILIQGTIRPTGIPGPGAREVVVDIGGVIRRFTLDEKGRSGPGSETLRIVSRRKSGLLRFRLRMRKGAYAPHFADEGLVGGDSVNRSASLTLYLLMDGSCYVRRETLMYKTGKGEVGVARKR